MAVIRQATNILLPAITLAGSEVNYYETSFPADEDPVSDFYGGLTDGTDFSDVKSVGGVAFATTTITNGVNDYEDSLALLKPSVKSVTRNHYVEITCAESGGGWSGSFEIEALVCGDTDFSFYEFLIQRESTSVQIIHQDGTLGGYTVLGSVSTGSWFEDGDVIRVEASHDDGAEELTLSVYFNESFVDDFVIAYASPYYLSGELPGMGFYVENGNTPSHYGISNFKAGPI